MNSRMNILYILAKPDKRTKFWGVVKEGDKGYFFYGAIPTNQPKNIYFKEIKVPYWRSYKEDWVKNSTIAIQRKKLNKGYVDVKNTIQDLYVDFEKRLTEEFLACKMGDSFKQSRKVY